MSLPQIFFGRLSVSLLVHYRSVTRLKAILLFDKQNEVTYPYAES